MSSDTTADLSKDKSLNSLSCSKTEKLPIRKQKTASEKDELHKSRNPPEKLSKLRKIPTSDSLNNLTFPNQQILVAQENPWQNTDIWRPQRSTEVKSTDFEFSNKEFQQATTSKTPILDRLLINESTDLDQNLLQKAYLDNCQTRPTSSKDNRTTNSIQSKPIVNREKEKYPLPNLSQSTNSLYSVLTEDNNYNQNQNQHSSLFPNNFTHTNYYTNEINPWLERDIHRELRNRHNINSDFDRIPTWSNTRSESYIITNSRSNSFGFNETPVVPENFLRPNKLNPIRKPTKTNIPWTHFLQSYNQRICPNQYYPNTEVSTPWTDTSYSNSLKSQSNIRVQTKRHNIEIPRVIKFPRTTNQQNQTANYNIPITPNFWNSPDIQGFSHLPQRQPDLTKLINNKVLFPTEYEKQIFNKHISELRNLILNQIEQTGIELTKAQEDYDFKKLIFDNCKNKEDRETQLYVCETALRSKCNFEIIRLYQEFNLHANDPQ